MIRKDEDYPRFLSCYIICGQIMKPYDVVALTIDLPDENLKKGQVGTIIEQWDDDVFEVEFSDLNGITYAMLALKATQLMVLHYEPIVSP